MKNIKDIILTISFVLFLSVIFILNIFKKDDAISLEERRALALMPKFSVNSLFNGTFMNKFDSYVTDQFIDRIKFRKLKANIELKIKNNYNDLYIKDDYIINNLYPLNKKSVINFSNKINYIKKTYLTDNNVHFMLIPDKNYFVDNGNLKINYDELKTMLLSNIDANYIDIFPLLSLNSYYKTDSHWKEEELIPIVKKLSTTLGFSFANDYKEEFITTFEGVYKGEIVVSNSYDELKVLRNSIIDSSTVYNYETNKYESVFNKDKLNSNDKYDYYLSGATPLITITNKSVKDKSLIVFRDSFASSLIPLLVPYYNKITLVDTRYISPKILGEYIDFKGSDVLFMYNVMTINNSSILR